MKKKSVFTIIPLIVFILVVTGCSTNVGQATPKTLQDEKTKTAVASEEKLQTVSISTSMASIDSVESLVSKSTVIVQGEVVGLDYFDFNSRTFTKVKIKVSNSFTDAVKVGEVVTFIDIGGITTSDKLKLKDGYEGKPGTVEPITEKDKTTKVKVLLDGSPLTKLNEQVIYFGVEDKEDFYKLSEKYYDPIGAYQGKFTIKDNIAERYTEDASTSSLKMSKLDLTEKIKNNLKK